MNHKYGIVRLYTLALTDMGCEQEEHDSEDARNLFLSKQSSFEDDWYCLDVREDFSVDFYLATTGPEALEN